MMLSTLAQGLQAVVLSPWCLCLVLWWLPMGSQRRRCKLAVCGTLAVVMLLATPLVGQAVLAGLEPPQAATMARVEALQDQDIDAVVILGGGLRIQAPEWPQGEGLKTLALVRVQYGAFLARRLAQTPVVVAGGPFPKAQSTESAVMKAVLVRDFGLAPTRVLEENQSRTTEENARYVAQLVRQQGWSRQRVLLVTEAYHMARAQAAFEREGLHVTPAPCNWRTSDTPGPPTWHDFQPSWEGLQALQFGLHERLGSLWYWLKALLRP